MIALRVSLGSWNQQSCIADMPLCSLCRWQVHTEPKILLRIHDYAHVYSLCISNSWAFSWVGCFGADVPEKYLLAIAGIDGGFLVDLLHVDRCTSYSVLLDAGSPIILALPAKTYHGNFKSIVNSSMETGNNSDPNLAASWTLLRLCLQ